MLWVHFAAKPVSRCFKESKWNKKERGFFSISSGKPKVVIRKKDLGAAWCFIWAMIFKQTLKGLKEWLNRARISVLRCSSQSHDHCERLDCTEETSL